ncbi:MAG: hypothetical protein WBA12_16400 [Catalinimonas sp.]
MYRLTTLLSTLLLLGAACEQAEQNLTATVEEIRENPAMYSDQRITFSGEVEQMLGNESLVVDEMPVVVNENTEIRGGKLGEGQVAQISGRLGVIGEGNLKAESFIDIDIVDGEVVFIAESILLAKARRAATAPKDEPTEPPVEVTVGDVMGDAVFMVETGEGQMMPVYLEEVATPGTPIEGRYKIERGQNVTIRGSLQPMPDESTITGNWKLLDEQEIGKLTGYKYYYRAQRIDGVPADKRSEG